MNKKLAIVIPTYNEAENIGFLIEQIFMFVPGAHVVIVDDNSPDGTAAKVIALQKKYRTLHCLVRKENKGRGYAGVDGFRYALSLDADYIMEMDADLSHDPEYMSDFLGAIEDADVVIGSRFIRDGRDIKRSLPRKIISILANAYLRISLGVSVRDCTSGYRCFRRAILEQIDLNTLRSSGPSILEELLYRCRKCRIKEIPIHFAERRAGKSKLDGKTLLHCLVIPWFLRWNKKHAG